MGVQPRTPFALLPHSLSLARELIKNSKYVSNLICAFISLCMCTCVCVCEAPLIAGQGVRKGCSHLIFPLWSLNMYKPEVGYVSVPTPHKHASVCNCECVCNISTKNSRPVLFYQHLGIVARHRARLQRELRPLQRLTLHTKWDLWQRLSQDLCGAMKRWRWKGTKKGRGEGRRGEGKRGEGSR